MNDQAWMSTVVLLLVAIAFWGWRITAMLWDVRALLRSRWEPSADNDES
jgi:hypothetical protein